MLKIQSENDSTLQLEDVHMRRRSNHLVNLHKV